jgi:hypothetical protein
MGFILSICFIVLQFGLEYVHLGGVALYCLIGLLVFLIELLVSFLKQHRSLNLQEWETSSHTVIKGFCFILILNIIIQCVCIIIWQVQLILILVSLILLSHVIFFLYSALKLNSNITCHESVPDAKILTFMEYVIILPSILLLYTSGIHSIPFKFLISGVIISGGPIFISMLITKFTWVASCYEIILSFIEEKYTFVYSTLCFLLLILPLLGINYILLSTLGLLISRSFSFLLVYHKYTITKLHHTFCCATSVAWQRLKTGGAIATGLVAAANTPIGQQMMGFVEGGLDRARDLSNDLRLKSMNDEMLASGVCNKTQHAKNSQRIFDNRIGKVESLQSSRTTKNEFGQSNHSSGLPPIIR